MMKRNLKEFPGISHNAFQHPFDRQATEALRKIPGIRKFVTLIAEKGVEKVFYYNNISARLQVNEKQYPTLYRNFVRLAQVLDIRRLPSLFIETTPEINAFSMGIENYSIVLNTGIIDIMEEEELLAVLAHELGHVKCEHQLYKTTAFILTTFGEALFSQMGDAGVPFLKFFLSAGSLGIQAAVLDWSRKAEFSCDRAALLGVQDPDVVSNALVKLAGFSKKYADELNIQEVENQADRYQEYGNESILVKLLKFHSMLENTHPFPILRVREIRKWARSDEYDQILKGNYKLLAPQKTPEGWVSVTIGTPRARQCQKCGYPNDEDYSFCLGCQTNIRNAPVICSHCRNPVQDDWLHCMDCGSGLSAETTPL